MRVQRSALGPAIPGELHGSSEVASGRLEIELCGSIPGQEKRLSEALLDLRLLHTCRSSELVCLAVVVDEDPRLVLLPLACDLLDPASRGRVLLGARRAGYLLVRHVSDERMPEGELVLALDGRTPNRTDELPTDELVQVAEGDLAALETWQP